MKNDTLAFVVAGRALDTYLVTRAQLARLREVCATVPDLAVIAAGDVMDGADGDPLYMRVVIGFVAVRVQSESANEVTAEPFGPLDPAAIAAALARARAVDDMTWARIAAIVPRSTSGFTAAQQRAALTDEQRAVGWAGVAFDGADLRATTDRVFLVASGPLAGAVLARGDKRVLPYDDEESDFPEDFDEDAWVFHGGNNERPSHGVFGERAASVHIEGHGAVALSEAELVGPLYLLAVYD